MNRHGSELDDFMACVQATLNRNGHKPGLDTMDLMELEAKLFEEWSELSDELLIVEPDPRAVEREAADLAVVALAAFMWARNLGRKSARWYEGEE